MDTSLTNILTIQEGTPWKQCSVDDVFEHNKHGLMLQKPGCYQILRPDRDFAMAGGDPEISHGRYTACRFTIQEQPTEVYTRDDLYVAGLYPQGITCGYYRFDTLRHFQEEMIRFGRPYFAEMAIEHAEKTQGSVDMDAPICEVYEPSGRLQGPLVLIVRNDRIINGKIEREPPAPVRMTFQGRTFTF